LTRIAFDDTHTLHRRHAFEALRTLAQFTFPRPQAVVLETSDDGDASTMIAHFVQVATARLDQRRRDAERNGAYIACGHSGVSTELEVATTIPAGDGTETGRSLDDSGGVRFVVHRDGRARAARTR